MTIRFTDTTNPRIRWVNLPAEPTDDTNDERAELGDRALDPIVIANGCDSYEALIDTLANLMHMCNRDDLDFAAALSIAADHFAAERTN